MIVRDVFLASAVSSYVPRGSTGSELADYAASRRTAGGTLHLNRRERRAARVVYGNIQTAKAFKVALIGFGRRSCCRPRLTQATGDDQRFSRDPPGILRRQENGGRRNVFSLADAAQRGLRKSLSMIPAACTPSVSTMPR